MKPKPNHGDEAATADWSRFNDDVLSLRLGSAASPEPLAAQLAGQGVELVVDARPHLDHKTAAIQRSCERAGLYYVPGRTREESLDVSTRAVSRYVNLALRHKTCVLVEEEADELLVLIAEQLDVKVVDVDDGGRDLE